MGIYGLLGEHLGHTYSPRLHRLLGGYDYGIFEVAPEALADFLTAGRFDGLNVTIPYKKAVVPYCAALSDAARLTGSVNTILRRSDGTLFGDNTDYAGFARMISDSGVPVRGKKILVLGDGGVAPTVRAVLHDLGAGEIVTISRRGENHYGNLARHADAQGIVNTTPVGMYPACDAAPLSLTGFPALEAVWDLIYNPYRTELMLRSEALGVPAFGGLTMLVFQAKAAAERFLGAAIPEQKALDALNTLRGEMRNIALIGMPGCGKSSTGAALANLTGRRLIELDAELERAAGKSIPRIFAEDGEAAFRTLETQILARWSGESGLILSTGGGVVTRPENLPLLRRNSVIVRLDRDAADLPSGGRPLSQEKGAQALYRERAPLYAAWAEYTIRAESPEDGANQIKELLNL